MTLRGMRALQNADVVLYDRLVSDEILALARRDAHRIYVGKAAGKAHVPQEGINDLLVKLAQEGKRVCRLKGGDPFIFGRGGEELDALRAACVPIEIVPGVTAGIAAAASVQIPLTHRDVSHTVTFLSGHEAGGEEPSFEHLDLAALASGKNTLLVYMGVTTAGAIATKLIAAGFKPDLPVLAVENASRDDERRVLATVAELAAHPERLGLNSPAVLIFGEVAGLPAHGVIEDILSMEEVKIA
jgi:uroporphyrin-III C-methyltransferase/precorrin-2 dehydrogenase/sirohydrochlorin ferrochelatase